MSDIEIDKGLEGYLAKDSDVIEHSRKHFGPELAMLGRLADTYGRLSALVVVADPNLNLPAQLFMVVRNQLYGIVSALVRRRTTDAQALTRRSIEATAIAHHLSEHPELATVFNEAYSHISEDGHPQQWSPSGKYRDEFKTGKIFSGEGETWKRLREYYAMFSAAASHAGLFALIRQTYKDGYLRMPPREEKGYEVGRSWFAITYLYWDMLKVFLTILKPAIKDGNENLIEQDMKIWRSDFDKHAKERTFWIPKPEAPAIISLVPPKQP